jgi:hypothetical protein
MMFYRLMLGDVMANSELINERKREKMASIKTITVSSDKAQRKDDMDIVASFAENMGWIKPISTLSKSGNDTNFLNMQISHNNHAPFFAPTTTTAPAAPKIDYLLFDAEQAIRDINELIAEKKLVVDRAYCRINTETMSYSVEPFTLVSDEITNMAKVVASSYYQPVSASSQQPEIIKTNILSAIDSDNIVSVSSMRFITDNDDGDHPSVDAEGSLLRPCTLLSGYAMCGALSHGSFLGPIIVSMTAPKGWTPVECSAIIGNDDIVAYSATALGGGGGGGQRRTSYTFRLAHPDGGGGGGGSDDDDDVVHFCTDFFSTPSVFSRPMELRLKWRIEGGVSEISKPSPCVRIRTSTFNFCHLADFNSEKLWRRRRMKQQTPTKDDPLEYVYTSRGFESKQAEYIIDSMDLTCTSFKAWFMRCGKNKEPI